MPLEKVIEELENEIHLVEYVDGLYAENISLELLKSVRDLITRQQAEIERLKKDILIARDAYTMLQTKNEIVKSEAVKEFAEKLENEINRRTTLSREQDKNVIHIIHNLQLF